MAADLADCALILTESWSGTRASVLHPCSHSASCSFGVPAPNLDTILPEDSWSHLSVIENPQGDGGRGRGEGREKEEKEKGEVCVTSRQSMPDAFFCSTNLEPSADESESNSHCFHVVHGHLSQKIVNNF